MSGEGTRRGEFELIAALFRLLSKGAPGAFGLTDDAALIDVSPGHQLVTTVDTLIAGVHFRSDDPPELIARKALRVNLSDLAAKGAKPTGFLHALALNTETGDAFLERYAAGLAADVDEFAVPLLGGDTTSGPGPLAITITAFGEVKTGTMLLRSGAQPGDVLCVTGTIGDGALGLACLNGTLTLPTDVTNSLIERYRVPRPRLAAGAALAGLATACLDISDGLVADVGHIAETSHVGAEIDRDRIPLSPGARAALKKNPELWELVLGGGDDYELAFAVPAVRAADLPALAKQLGLSLTPIGSFDAGGTVNVTVKGKPVQIARSGYRHR